MMFGRKKTEMVAAADALPGRNEAVPVPALHEVTGNPLTGPFRDGLETAVFGMGCFWGAERMYWQAKGVYTTSVGYVGGHTPNPSYEEVCSALTGHNEVLMVVFDTAVTSYGAMLKIFWEGHNPTEGMRQGNDIGTQYRSGIYTTSPEQQAEAEASLAAFQPVVSAAGFADITTEIIPLETYYYAEHYHQQYLHKVPNGYCGLGGTGLSCPVGIASA